MRCFVDADGVLGDFDQHVIDLFGVHPRRVPDEELWEMVQTVPEFWLTIPLKHGAQELWAVLQPYSPIILTGCPRGHYDLAAGYKVTWAKQHFGEDVSIITCLSREKPLHMQSADDILIDDFSSNVRRWKKAGGRAVHYRTFEQAITDLRTLLDATGTLPTTD